MKTPYTIAELDALMTACVSFTDQHEQYFTTGYIAGREGVNTDIDSVRRMMDWVVGTDKGLLEYSGLGKDDDVPYFRLGYDAKRMLKNGGFRTYVRDKTLRERLDYLRLWAPMCISLLAVIVSIFAWQTPKVSSSRLDELTIQLDRLRTDQQRMQANLDSISSRLSTTTPIGR